MTNTKIKNLKNYLVTGGGILLASLFNSNAAAQNTIQGSLEISAGESAINYDSKINLITEKGIGIFSRNIINADNNFNNVNHFSLVDIYKNFYKGLNVVFEAQFVPKENISPRAGFQYFTKKNDFRNFSLITAKLEKDSNVEWVNNLGYTPKINKKLNLFIQLETLTNFGKSGHNFSVIRPRLGLKASNYRFGFSPDFSLDSNGKVGKRNLGGFFGYDF